MPASPFEAFLSTPEMLDAFSSGDYLHIYTESFGDRFFFEIAQRVQAYDAHGALNAPARMASRAAALV